MDAQDDVLIVGGGVAGLAAAATLHEAGLRVRLIEARERLGGRAWSIHVPELAQVIEMGAEFIHGKPPEIFSIADKAGLEPIELGGETFTSDGTTVRGFDLFDESESVLEEMDDSGPDRSFADFVREKTGQDDAESLAWAMRYVRGFHAANPALISVHAMVREAKAEEAIEGDRQFHPQNGYGALVDWYAKRLVGASFALQSPVTKIAWKAGSVEVHCGERVFRGRKAVITLPLGVLQAGTVRFEPALPEKEEAAGRLVMGKVLRVTLQFSERFWTRQKHGLPDLSRMHFLMTGDGYFPTWWTATPPRPGGKHPGAAPLLVGWAPDECAERLRGRPHREVIGRARESLENALPQYATEIGMALVGGYFHDWQSDPFACGAYSYVKAGGEGGQKGLAAAVENTLFFAGEATEWNGHHATVHGAIATGLRAAQEAGESLGR